MRYLAAPLIEQAWIDRPDIDYRITVLDDDGQPCPVGAVGQVWFREGGRQFEYKGDPATTEAAATPMASATNCARSCAARGIRPSGRWTAGCWHCTT